MKRMLVFFGLFETLIAVSIIFFFLIQLNSIYTQLDLGPARFIIAYAYFCLMLILGIVQILRGLLFKNSNEKTSKYLFVLGIGFLVLLIPAFFMFIIYPIYGLMDVIG